MKTKYMIPSKKLMSTSTARVQEVLKALKY